MEDIFHNIGVMSVIALAFYLYLRRLSNNERKKEENRTLARFSNKGEEVLKKELSEFEFDKELNKVFRDSKEKEAAINKKREYDERHLAYQLANEQEQKENRKFGYKYENDIFEIYNIDDELSTMEIIIRISDHYNIHTSEAEDILELWHRNSLLSYSRKNDIYSIGLILTSEYFSLTESDLTRSKWLKINNKELEYEEQQIRNKKIKEENDNQKRQQIINKYRDDVFNLLVIDDLRSKREFITGVQKLYNIDIHKANELFYVFLKNNLIDYAKNPLNADILKEGKSLHFFNKDN